MEVRYVIGLKMIVMWIFPKLVNYEKSHFPPKRFVWFNYSSKWFYESILSNSMHKNIKKCVRLIMGWSLSILTKIRWCKGETNIHGL